MEPGDGRRGAKAQVSPDVARPIRCSGRGATLSRCCIMDGIRLSLQMFQFMSILPIAMFCWGVRY